MRLLLPRARPPACPARDVVPEQGNASGSTVDAGRDAPTWAQRAERAADGGVVDVSRALSVSPGAPRINAQRGARLTPIIPATACHQRNYIERYSRSNWTETTALPPKSYTDGAHVRGKASTLPGVAERICQHAQHLRPLGHSCHYGCTDAVRHSVSVRILQALMPNP